MIEQTFKAMGTTIVSLHAPGTDLGAVRRRFEEVEQACSRFRHDSDLSRVYDAPDADITVPPLLGSVLADAQRIRHSTGGLVDAGLGAAVRVWGYDRTFAEVADLEHYPDPVADPVWSYANGVLHRSRGTLIDLGGIAKGWTADAAVSAGEAEVVSAGGDVRSSAPDTVVDVVDPSGDVAVTLRLGVGGLATSSVARRTWKVAGERANHIIDPRTGAPAAGPVVSATALCARAVDAEAAAKAVLLKGADGLAWAEAQPWVRAALVVWDDGSVYATREVETA